MMRISAFNVAMNETWALDEASLRRILEIAAREHDVDLEAVEALPGRRMETAAKASLRDGVATVPISGPIFRYANLFTQVSGATSIEETARDLRQAIDDPQVKAILLAIDSPGGTVNGTNELAKMVRNAAERKPVAAYISHHGTSGAYWIASAARQIFADETALLGSIGIVAAVIDESKRDEARGIRQITFVSNQSPNKRPNPDTDEGRAVIQMRVDELAQVFVESVARNRGVTPEIVINEFGRGGVLLGREAVALGMADGISSYEEVLAGLASGQIAGAAPRHPTITINKESATMQTTTAAATAALPAPTVSATPASAATVSELLDHVAAAPVPRRQHPSAIANDEAAAQVEDVRTWEASTELRAEFLDDKEAWIAYGAAVRRGQVRGHRPR